MICEECSGQIDELTGCCMQCGLETLDVHIYRGLKGGSVDGRANNASLAKNKYDRRGFTCMRCLELFGEPDGRTVELEEKMSGRERPGSNLASFTTKAELKQHMRLHGINAHQRPDKALRSLYKPVQRQKPTEEGSGENK
jgi:hypothetical protein